MAALHDLARSAVKAARILGLVAAALIGVSAAAAAPPYDGSTPLQCGITAVMACSGPESCVRGTAATVVLPPVLVIDVDRRLVSGDRGGRTIRITAVGRGGGRLMLHGEEIEIGGRAWNVVIKEATGEMTGAVLSEPGGYLMFGSCAGS
jgi:hypothetical protein